MAVKDSEGRMVLMKKINGCSVLKSIVNKKIIWATYVNNQDEQTDGWIDSRSWQLTVFIWPVPRVWHGHETAAETQLSLEEWWRKALDWIIVHSGVRTLPLLDNHGARSSSGWTRILCLSTPPQLLLSSYLFQGYVARYLVSRMRKRKVYTLPYFISMYICNIDHWQFLSPALHCPQVYKERACRGHNAIWAGTKSPLKCWSTEKF